MELNSNPIVEAVRKYPNFFRNSTMLEMFKRGEYDENGNPTAGWEVDGDGPLTTLSNGDEVRKWAKLVDKVLKDNDIFNSIESRLGYGHWNTQYSNIVHYHEMGNSPVLQDDNETFDMKLSARTFYRDADDSPVIPPYELHQEIVNKFTKALTDKFGDDVHSITDPKGKVHKEVYSYLFPRFNSTVMRINQVTAMLRNERTFQQVLEELRKLHKQNPKKYPDPDAPEEQYYTWRCTTRTLEKPNPCKADPGINNVYNYARAIAEDGDGDIVEASENLDIASMCERCVNALHTAGVAGLYYSRPKFAEYWLGQTMHDMAVFNSYFTASTGRNSSMDPSLTDEGLYLFNAIFGEHRIRFNMATGKKERSRDTANKNHYAVAMSPFIQSNYVSKSNKDNRVVSTIVIDNDNGEELPKLINAMLPKALWPHILTRTNKGYQAIWVLHAGLSKEKIEKDAFTSMYKTVETALKRYLKGDMAYSSINAYRHRNPFYIYARTLIMNDPFMLFYLKDFYHSLKDLGFLTEFTGPYRNYGESPQEFEERIGFTDVRRFKNSRHEVQARRYGVDLDSLAGLDDEDNYDGGNYPRPGNDFSTDSGDDSFDDNVLPRVYKTNVESVTGSYFDGLISRAIANNGEFDTSVGYRNNSLFHTTASCCYMLRVNLRNYDSIVTIADIINSKFEQPLPDNEVAGITQRIYRYMTTTTLRGWSDNPEDPYESVAASNKEHVDDNGDSERQKKARAIASHNAGVQRKPYNKGAYAKYSHNLVLHAMYPILKNAHETIMAEGIDVKYWSDDALLTTILEEAEKYGVETIQELPRFRYSPMNSLFNFKTYRISIKRLYSIDGEKVEYFPITDIISDDQYKQYLRGHADFQKEYRNVHAARAEGRRLERLDSVRAHEIENERYRQEVDARSAVISSYHSMITDGVAPEMKHLAEFAHRAIINSERKIAPNPILESDDEAALELVDKLLSEHFALQSRGFRGYSEAGSWGPEHILHQSSSSEFWGFKGEISHRLDQQEVKALALGDYALVFTPDDPLQLFRFYVIPTKSEMKLTHRSNFGITLARIVRQLCAEYHNDATVDAYSILLSLLLIIGVDDDMRDIAILMTPGVENLAELHNYIMMNLVNTGDNDAEIAVYAPRWLQDVYKRNPDMSLGRMQSLGEAYQLWMDWGLKPFVAPVPKLDIPSYASLRQHSLEQLVEFYEEHEWLVQ